MPTYEYRCKSCGKNMEVFQKMTEKPLSYCLQCGGALERLIGKGSGIIFKGSGFYATEYRSESYKKGEKQEKQEKQNSEPKESKPKEKEASKNE